jgi:hypothetical protein
MRRTNPTITCIKSIYSASLRLLAFATAMFVLLTAIFILLHSAQFKFLNGVRVSLPAAVVGKSQL